MSRLEKLIEELCPDGVKRKKLHEVANLVMGISPAGKTFSNDPSWGIEFHQGKTYFTEMVLGCSGTYTSEPIRRANAGSIIMSVRAPVGDSNIVDRKIAIGRGLCAISGKQGSHTKYLYYYLNAILPDIKRRSTGSTFESINSNEIKELPIPIPPLPVQLEIVRILDHFTELTAELSAKLTAELAARQKQYEYYRDLLLTFDDSVPHIMLGELATITIGEFVRKDKQSPDAPYPVFNGGTTNTGYYWESNNTGDKIIISARGANAGFVNRVFTDYWAGNSCYTINVKEHSRIDWNYLFYFLKNEQARVYEQQQKGGIPAVSKRQVEEYSIPLPPLAEQERIVGILDRFDALVNDLTTGLPAEIEARRKQYEYYRDKLLTFKEATP